MSSEVKRTCKHGHLLTDENLKLNKNGNRICRECTRRDWRKWYDRTQRKKPVTTETQVKDVVDEKSTVPAPGSSNAILQGCECSPEDNRHGKGYMGVLGVYQKSPVCKLHGQDVTFGDAVDGTTYKRTVVKTVRRKYARRVQADQETKPVRKKGLSPAQILRLVAKAGGDMDKLKALLKGPSKAPGLRSLPPIKVHRPDVKTLRHWLDKRGAIVVYRPKKSPDKIRFMTLDRVKDGRIEFTFHNSDIRRRATDASLKRLENH